MSIEREQRVLELLDAVLDQPPEQRARYLDRECADDTSMLRKVESMLETESAPGRPDLKPAFDVYAEDQGVGRTIGGYTLTQLLDRGGMGAVYLAERQDFEQKVALKVIRRGLDVDQISVKRFHNERQILARLTHPNIAHLLDGGATADHLPYFVMEYVEGEPLTRYCRHHQLSIASRLKLFRKVCSAVQFAHRNLVVHRDLKPGNILVTADGEPKLLDFGIAKMLDENLAPHPLTTLTQEGPLTPRYASPEQIRSQPITTASDVYSLGVLLYELLTGLDPYHADSKQRMEMERAICEEEPDKPSTAVRRRADECTTKGRAPNTASPSAAEDSAIDTKRLRRQLSGDLDSIVLKAMRKEPELRYSSVEQLSEDILRHLDGLPVLARSGAFAYRAGKFLKRNQLALAVTLAFVLLGLVLGLLWKQEADERAASDKERDIAVQRSESSNSAQGLMSEFIADLVRGLTRGTEGSNLTMSQLAERAAQNIDSPKLEPLDQIQVAGGVAQVFLALERQSEAERFMRSALEKAQDFYDKKPHPEVALRLNNLGALFFQQEKCEEAEVYFSRSLRMRIDLGQPAFELFRVKNNLASTLKCQNQLEDALAIYKEILAARQEAYDSLENAVDQDVATSHWHVAATYFALGDQDSAEPHARKALEARRLAELPRKDRIARAAHLLGMIQATRSVTHEAEELYRESIKLLEESGRSSAGVQKDLAEVLASRDLESAHDLILKALGVLSSRTPESVGTAEARTILGSILVKGEQYSEAEPFLVKSYSRIREERGPASWRKRKALQHLIDLYEAWGKPEELAKYQAEMEGLLAHE
ncbi:MAG: serine/threonine-protein kinase [Acidobacteriota bacterium]